MDSKQKEIIYGLTESLFLLQPRHYANCITDGKNYLDGVIGLMSKMQETHYYL